MKVLKTYVLLIVIGSFFCWQVQPVMGQEKPSSALLKDETSGLNYLHRKCEDPNAPNIIMLHGFRSNEKDLYSFEQFFPKANFYSLQAPIPYSQGGFAWYSLEFNADGTRTRNLNQARINTEKVKTFIEQIKKSSSGLIIIGGFSQGAILSVKLVLTYPELLDGAICFSGMPMSPKLTYDNTKRSRYEQLKVFCGHGTKDNVIPVSDGRACKKLLEDAQIQLWYKEYPMKHQISQEEINDLLKWYNESFETKK